MGTTSDESRTFARRFRLLVALCWSVPPVFGLGFLVLVVEMFTVEQLLGMLLVPPLPIYVVGAQLGSDAYFRRFVRPILAYLNDPSEALEGPALARARRFPLDFWIVFLTYLILAPVFVMWSAVWGTDFRPTSIDWVRIELVSLIVSIIVGLPIFFLLIDRFGEAFHRVSLRTSHVTVRTKVFLIGALVPLLIDTMLVQYYWTETGYFTAETFGVWLVLELLAVAGALLFVRSFGQSLEPLARVVQTGGDAVLDPAVLAPQSTDELGVLAGAYQVLLGRLRRQSELLELKNRILRGPGGVTAVAERVRDVADEILQGQRSTVFLSRDDQWIAVAGAGGTPHQAGWLPLVVEGREIGGLVVQGGDRELLEALAQEAAPLLHAAVVRERSEQVQEQLNHARRLEGVGQLAGGIAHDFNNILTAIMANASFLRMDLAEGDPRTEDVDAVLDQARRAADLTRQLLAFSRHQVLETRILDPTRVVSNLVRMLERLLRSDIVLEVDLVADPWLVQADRSQLEQVVVNLVVNARDALPGGGRISMRVRHEDGSDGQWVLLEVEDTGTGIEPALHHRVFEPYFTTKGVGKGTGLGLATVYGIVSQSGGAVSISSVPGEGSTFTVRLPRAFGELTDDPSAPPSIAPATGAVILLAEDDPALRGLASRALTLAGHEVLVASDGEQALGLFRSEGGAVTMLVTDVVMPGMRGTELARRLQAERPRLQVLLLTGYADEEALDAAVDLEVPLLRKPFTPMELVQRVAELVARPA